MHDGIMNIGHTASQCVVISLLVSNWILSTGGAGRVQAACQSNGVEHVPDADVRFALMLQLRDHESGSNSPNCQITARGLQHYLAVEWLIDRINSYNNNTGYIPGVKIGYTSYDDCGGSVYSGRNSVSFFNNSLPYMGSTCQEPPQAVSSIGIIGPDSSRSSMTVSSLLKDQEVPIISPSSTVQELSNKDLYPTFLRTVPSEIQQMTLLVDILQQLKWTYVALVYQDDIYGTSGKSIFKQKAKERGICIHSKDLVLPQEDGVIGNHFNDVLKHAFGNSIGVIIIANNSQVADDVLYALDIRVSLNKRGLHYILLEAVSTDVSVFRVNQGQATLTISTGNGNLQMDDLKRELNEMFKLNQQSHSLIDEYIGVYGQPDAFIANNLDPFLLATINAVMALVEGFKSLHHKECTSTDVCKSLRTKIKKGELLKEVKTRQVDYSTIPEDVIPASLRNSQLIFSFDTYGDIQLSGTIPMYTIHSYDARVRNYKQVGSYKGGKMSLDVSNIKWQTPSGDYVTEVPTSMCTGVGCQECKRNAPIPVMLLEGDVYIVGILSLHDADPNDPFKCGEYRSIANDAVVAEGFLFAVKQMREQTGINYGLIGFDDCYSPSRVTGLLSYYFSDMSPFPSVIFPYKIPREKIVCVIGCLSSGSTIPTTTFFMPLNIPVVSYSASSPDLDDIIDFPYFLRTVPSDIYQAQVMANILQQMGWEYVGLLYVNNNYGAKGMKAFRNIVDIPGSGICAAKEIAIKEKRTKGDTDLYEAFIRLTGQKVKVIVFFGIVTRFLDVIENLESIGDYGKFVFVASEEWGDNERIKNAGINSARGSITLKLQDVGLEGEEKFKQHLLEKRPSVNDRNVWFREFWQDHFNCHFKGAFISNFQKECDVDQMLTSSKVEEMAKDQRTRHMINAVYAVGKGLKEVQDIYCIKAGLQSCEFLLTKPEVVVDIIKKQKRLDGVEIPVFDDSGNGATGFDIFNIQKVRATNEYVKVGTFERTSEELKTSEDLKKNVKTYDRNGEELPSYTARCGQDTCVQCQHKKTAPLPVETTPEGEPSVVEDTSLDIVIIVLVILLIVIIAILAITFTCCFRKGYFHQKNSESENYALVKTVYPDHSETFQVINANQNISPFSYSSECGNNASPYSPNSERLESISQVASHRPMNITGPYPSSSSGNCTNDSSFQNKVLQNRYSTLLSNQSYPYATDQLRSNLPQSDIRIHSTEAAAMTLPNQRRRQSIEYSAPPAQLNTSNLELSNVIYDTGNLKVVKTAEGKAMVYKNPPTSNSSQSNVSSEPGAYNYAGHTQLQQGQNFITPQMFVTQDDYEAAKYQTPNSFAPINYNTNHVEMQPMGPAVQSVYENSQPMDREQMRVVASSDRPVTAMPHIYSIPNSNAAPVPRSHPGLIIPMNPNPQVDLNTENLAMIDPSLQNTWMGISSADDEISQRDQSEDSKEGMTDGGGEWGDRGSFPDSNSSIPDVISGKMPQAPTTPPIDTQGINLESLNLETNSVL